MGVFVESRTLCDYGCGEEAKYTFENGNRCCSRYPVQCESIREKISESLKSYHNVNGKKKFEVVSCSETEYFE